MLEECDSMFYRIRVNIFIEHLLFNNDKMLCVQIMYKK